MGQFIDEHDVRRPTEFPRISPRYPIPPLKAIWYPPARRLVGSPAAVEVRLVDISVAGALIQGPHNKRLSVGSRIPIEFQGTEGIADVRNIRPSEHRDSSYYGISYFNMSPEMSELVHAVVRRIRSENDLTTLWERRKF